MSHLAKKLTPFLVATMISHPVMAQNDVIFRYNPKVIVSASTEIMPLEIGDLYVGENFSRKATLNGGSGSATWSLVGTLPNGLSFERDGTLHGIPSETGTFSGITLVAVDGSGVQTRYSGISISVYGQVSGTSFIDRLDLGDTTTVVLPVTGGKGALASSLVSGSLPPGLHLIGANISGTPTVLGDYHAIIKVIDANQRSATIDVNISVAAALNASAKLQDAYVGEAYTGRFEASGGSSIYTWSADNLPAGLRIEPSSGVLSGSVNASGSFGIVGNLSDGYKFKTVQATIDAYRLPELASKVYPDVYVGDGYTNQEGAAPTVTGGKLPLTYSASGLPAGLSIAPSSGLITGTSTSSGATTAVIEVTDSNGKSATRSFTFSSLDALEFESEMPTSGAVGSELNAAVTAAGGQLPYSYSAVGLPPGISIRSATGTLTGILSGSGTFHPEITVTDGNGKTAKTTSTFQALAPFSVTYSANAELSQSSPESFFIIPGDPIVMKVFSPIVSGGSGDYIYSATEMPPGVSFNTTTGAMTGANTTSGVDYEFTISVTDKASGQTIARTFRITVQ